MTYTAVTSKFADVMASFPRILPKQLPPPEGPPGGSGGSRIPLPRRRKVQLACIPCRKAKTRCDGLRPSCSVCTGHSRTCTYPVFDKRTKSYYTAHIQNLDDKIKDLESTVLQLQPRATPEPIDNPPPIPSASDPALADPKGKRPVRDIQSTPIATTPRPFIQSDDTELSEEQYLKRYDTGFGLIPTEPITCYAISSFFACIGTLLYIEDRQAAQVLINNVYNQHATNVQNTCELCAIAAVGCQFNNEHVPIACKDAYFQHAVLLLWDTLEAAPTRAIRVIICLTTYLILTHLRSSMALLECGLSLSRQLLSLQRRVLMPFDNKKRQTERLFQTLITLESWLSINVHYMPNFAALEAGLIPYPNPSEAESIIGGMALSPDLIQFHFSKVAVISAQVHTGLRNIGDLHWQDIQKCSNTLDSWRQQLPESLQLQALLTEDNGMESSSRRSLLMLHMIYLESQVLLYDEYIRRNQETIMLKLTTETRQTYSGFAQQLAHIISIIYEDKSGFIQTWMLIHATFRTCIALLIDLCQCLWIPGLDAQLLTDVKNIDSCLSILQYCSSKNPAAARFVSLLMPLYKRANLLRQESMISTSSLEVEPMQLQTILNHPREAYLKELFRDIVQSMKISSGEKLW
ncbi:hypothetical protein BJX63DRAFT_370241 [Aspergillus granulosus]|uniref:Zn(2)-C6 fungal-type domain-containing protein n=1 Tax=Aspergillus granulosus TaxID=176169 RepID=A0ABR4H155_9EURO